MHAISLATNLYYNMLTLNLIFFFIEDLQILLESLFCFFPLGIILLQILAKIDEMNLYLKISFSYFFFFRFEVLLMSMINDFSTFWISLFGLKMPNGLHTSFFVLIEVWLLVRLFRIERVLIFFGFDRDSSSCFSST